MHIVLVNAAVTNTLPGVAETSVEKHPRALDSSCHITGKGQRPPHTMRLAQKKCGAWVDSREKTARLCTTLRVSVCTVVSVVYVSRTRAVLRCALRRSASRASLSTCLLGL